MRDRNSETAHLFTVLDVLHQHISLKLVNLGGDTSRDRVDPNLLYRRVNAVSASSASGRTWHVQRVRVRGLGESEYQFTRHDSLPSSPRFVNLRGVKCVHVCKSTQYTFGR